jgi:galactonate dehydratase
LTSLVAAHVCTAIRNFMILELDVDDAPWRDDILTEPLDIRNGHLYASDRPGWGADLVESEIAKHPYRAIPDAS